MITRQTEVEGIGQIGMGAGFIRPTLSAWFKNRYTFMTGAPKIIIDRSVRILDLSFYQGSDVDFVKIKAAGVAGVILRAGQNLWQDPEFQNNRTKAKDAGLPWGSYYFFDSRVRPQSQADNWATILAGDYGQLDHNGDYEETYGGSYSGWANYWHFMKEENDSYGGGFRWLTKLSERSTPLYTGYWYTQLTGKMPYGNAASLAWFAKSPLWLAWYTNDPSIVRIPSPWMNDYPSLLRWQWSSKGVVNGVPGNVDENNHNGDLANYKAHYNLNGSTPPPPPDPVLPTIQVVYNPAEVNVEVVQQ